MKISKDVLYIKLHVKTKRGEYANRLLVIGFLRKLFGFKLFFYLDITKLIL